MMLVYGGNPDIDCGSFHTRSSPLLAVYFGEGWSAKAIRSFHADRHFWSQEVDFHIGVGLALTAVDHLVGIGYSFRFHRIRG
jgi:hypothetical protein